jgi:hypothetical protein
MGRTGTKVDALGTLGDVKAFVAVVVTLLIFELFIYLFTKPLTEQRCITLLCSILYNF